MRTQLLQTFAVGVALEIAACGSDHQSPANEGGGVNPSNGGGPGSGGTSPFVTGAGGAGGGVTAPGGAGTSSGQNVPAGSGSGGNTSGGNPGIGGAGVAPGGGNTGIGGSGGGAPSGGSASGGNTGIGGAATGGAATGGVSASAGGGSGSAVNCSGAPLSGGQKYCSSTTGTLSNGVGYSVWLSSSTTGTNCGTFYGTGAAFKAQWSMGSGGDFLARAGLSFKSDKTYDQLGTMAADYAYTKTTSNTTAYIGIYGWSVSPLVEFYIVDEWIGWNPGSNATKKGTLTVDGDTYDIYTHTQTNQPSIQGTATFPQFFSIRKTARQCGHISLSQHFQQWGTLGMTLGKMYEAKLLVEAMGGSGTIDFTTATVTAQ